MVDRSLVVGGCGFLGSHVVDALLARGHEVAVLDPRPVPPPLASAWRGVRYVHGDMLHPTDVEAAVRGARYLFHYATTTVPKTSLANPELDNDNVLGALRILRAAVAAKVEKIVFPSSGGTVYGQPDRLPIPEDAPLRPRSPYAASKIAIEHHLEIARRISGLDYTVLRYGNPYGPRQDPRGNMGIVSVIFGLLRSGGTPTLYGDGSATKDFFFAEDAASAALAVLPAAEERVFNVASGKGTTIRELLDLMGSVVGRRIEPKRAPPLPGDEPACVLDTARIERIHGWKPQTDLREGLRRTWAWIQSLPS